jgi:kynurenine formamidase
MVTVHCDSVDNCSMFRAEFKDLIRDGKVYDLGQPWYPGMPHHPLHPPFAYILARKHGDVKYEEGVSAASDLFTFGGHTGTHLDALGHVSRDGKLFGGIEAAQAQDYQNGLLELSIDRTPPIIARGVLLDIPSHKKVHILNKGYPITPKDLNDTLTSQDIYLQPRDVVLIRTGWGRHWNDPNSFNDHQGVPGINLDAAAFLANKGISFVGGDTTSLEVVPTPSMPVHAFLLSERGIQIMEMLNLECIARHSIYEFLFIALPLRIRGATGSPIRPIAIR